MAAGQGIIVWRWKASDNTWLARHRDHREETAQPAEKKGKRGTAEGDWLIEDKHTGALTAVPNRCVPPTGTLWRWSERDHRWHHTYRRSSVAVHQVPDYIASLPGRPGDIVIDTGNLDDDEQVTFFDRNGDQGFFYEEHVAVYDFFEDPPSPVQVEDAPDAESWEEPVFHLFTFADRMHERWKKVKEIDQDWARYKPGDPVTVAMWQNLKQVLQEATPSPTPGTTAVIDTTVFVNDLVVAGHGIDDKGGALDDKAGIADVTYAKVVGELLAGAGSAFSYYRDLKRMIDLDPSERGTVTGERQYMGTLNTAAADTMLDVPKAVSNLFTATDKIIQLVDKASTAAQATSTVSQGIPFVGSAVGTLVFFRHVRKAHRARVRWSLFRRLVKQNQHKTPEMEGCLKYALGKSFRKTRTQAATATTAAVSTTGGTILGITAIVGGANAWNPVGWTLLGVALVGGTGIVGYKVYKRWTRKERHAKRMVKYLGIQTPQDLAAKLVGIVRNADHPDRTLAVLMLSAFGVDLRELGSEDARAAAAKIVARHFS